MKIAALADVHLGHRRYDRSAPGGMNQREADVAAVFQRAMAEVRAARPDVVAIAGDLFDRVRPSNHAITVAFLELRMTVEALPDAHIVLVGGNHSIPRTSETGCVLDLFGQLPRVHVVWRRPERLELPTGVVWGVPEGHEPPLQPEGVLVLHGEIEGVIPGGERPGQLPPSRLDGWRFVVLGHWHVHRWVRPNAAYVGACEYVSFDSWGELREEAEAGVSGKGWLLIDLADSGEPCVAFQPLPTRRFVDLEPLDATGMTVAEIDAALAARVAAVEIDGAAVRLIVREIARDFKRALDYGPIRQWKARALDFNLDLRRPEAQATPAARVAMHKRLDTFVAAYLGQRPIPPDMDRAAFVATGIEYLKSVTEDPYTGEAVDAVAERSEAG